MSELPAMSGSGSSIYDDVVVRGRVCLQCRRSTRGIRMTTRGIDHIGVTVPDIDQATAFFTHQKSIRYVQ